MKRLIQNFTVLFCLASCVKEPTASYSADKTTATAGDTVEFENTSEHASSFDWSFGDGTTSSEKNPSHVYSAPGSYEVNMTAHSQKEKRSSRAPVTTITVTRQNLLLYNGVGYRLQGAYATFYGLLSAEGHTTNIFSLSLTFSGDKYSRLFMFFSSPSPQYISAGQYNSLAGADDYRAMSGAMDLVYDAKNATETYLECSTMSVTVSKSVDQYTFDVMATLENGKPLTAYFRGPIR